jgi:hypothetical protein
MPYRESQRRREAPVRLYEKMSKAPEADVPKGCAHPVSDACRDESQRLLRHSDHSEATAAKDDLAA